MLGWIAWSKEKLAHFKTPAVVFAILLNPDKRRNPFGQRR
jgi:hypothetical protein